jgi:hypothetical protein
MFVMRRGPLIVALVATVSIPFSSPVSAEHTVWTQGVGLDSCGTFLASIEGLPIGKAEVVNSNGRTYFSAAATYQSWIEGYISGVNAYEPTREVRVDFPGIELWIRTWCESHPADALVDAVGHFLLSRWGVPTGK